MMRDANNDWTLDTNVLITANGSRASRRTRRQSPQSRDSRAQRRTRKQQARELFNCIARSGVWNWSSAIVQEYIARGAVNIQSFDPPAPVPVQNRESAIWMDFWLSTIQNRMCIRTFKPSEIQRLTGSEKDRLHSSQFRDRADHRFLELARSGNSRRLVTEEEDYSPQTIRAIRRILGVGCLDYQTALDQCTHG